VGATKLDILQKPDFMLDDKNRFSQINHWMIGLFEGLAKNFIWMFYSG
jgi:hypothetical protein